MVPVSRLCAASSQMGSRIATVVATSSCPDLFGDCPNAMAPDAISTTRIVVKQYVRFITILLDPQLDLPGYLHFEIYFFAATWFITTPVARQLPFCLMTTRKTLYSPSMRTPLLSCPFIVVWSVKIATLP